MPKGYITLDFHVVEKPEDRSIVISEGQMRPKQGIHFQYMIPLDPSYRDSFDNHNEWAKKQEDTLPIQCKSKKERQKASYVSSVINEISELIETVPHTDLQNSRKPWYIATFNTTYKDHAQTYQKALEYFSAKTQNK